MYIRKCLQLSFYSTGLPTSGIPVSPRTNFRFLSEIYNTEEAWLNTKSQLLLWLHAWFVTISDKEKRTFVCCLLLSLKALKITKTLSNYSIQHFLRSSLGKCSTGKDILFTYPNLIFCYIFQCDFSLPPLPNLSSRNSSLLMLSVVAYIYSTISQDEFYHLEHSKFIFLHFNIYWKPTTVSTLLQKQTHL